MTRTPKATVAVVEDDADLRELILEELEDSGYRTLGCADALDGFAAIQHETPHLVVSDLRLPGEDGLQLLDRCRRLAAPPAFIVITAFGTVEQAVTALKRGADDFLTKPIKLDHLQLAVARALERRDLRHQVAVYREMLEGGDFAGMIGRGAPMRQLFEQVRRIARANGPVLVLGESGVGKELVARALHLQSERRNGPFIAINCAGVPAELLESELFGHSAGAFTGAQKARKGLFAEAEGGTLMLDELGEMPAAMQAKMLRFLQDGTLRQVGDNRERRVDVRVVAATNRDLEEEVAQGRFRADLFYRLETFAIQVPPLRERGDDIDLLAAHFLSRHAEQAGLDVRGIAPEAMERLRAHPFPGNVRELSNAIERAVAFCHGDTLRAGDLPARIRDAEQAPLPDLGLPGMPPLRTVEQRYVRKVLEHTGNNKQRAARILGIGRRTLYRYLQEENGTPP